MYRGALLFDGHMDTPLRIVDEGVDIGARLADGHADLERLKEGGVDAVFMAAWIDPEIRPGGRMERAERLLQAIQGVAAAHPTRAVFATTAAEVRRAAATGRIALLAGIENAEALEGDPENAVRLHELGARYLTLTWMNSNEFADAAGGERLHGGLSALGRRLIDRLNEIGILVDLSHASVETFADVLDRSTRPPVVSHSATEVMGRHPRNLSDRQLRALAERDGVLGVNFFPRYLAPRTGTCDWTAIADHLERAIEVAGPTHVALGSDLDGIPQLPDGFSGAQDFPRIADELERRGVTADDLAAVLGGNWMRVLEDTEPTL
ncbi:MAG TPA: dipeptidase [Gemmatimonadota bacterium]|nr:dipeptidase [Gemmatimonadota bacterium]